MRRKTAEVASTGKGSTPATTDGPPDSGDQTGRSESARQVEQIALLLLALILGLIGLAVHVLWVVAIVLMALLLGLMASGVSSRRRGGVIADVAAVVATEAKSFASDIAPETTSHEEPASEPK
jgi:cobalamin synthase